MNQTNQIGKTDSSLCAQGRSSAADLGSRLTPDVSRLLLARIPRFDS